MKGGQQRRSETVREGSKREGGGSIASPDSSRMMFYPRDDKCFSLVLQVDEDVFIHLFNPVACTFVFLIGIFAISFFLFLAMPAFRNWCGGLGLHFFPGPAQTRHGNPGSDGVPNQNLQGGCTRASGLDFSRSVLLLSTPYSVWGERRAPNYLCLYCIALRTLWVSFVFDMF